MMGPSKFALVGALGALSGVTLAQFPPTPSGVTVLQSQVEEGARISYKEVRKRLHLYIIAVLNLNEERCLRDNRGYVNY